MPTNLKSLLTRSRSKNELKLREGSESSDSPSADDSVCKCESGGLHTNCLNDGCRGSSSEVPCTINIPPKSGSAHLQPGVESESDIYPETFHTSLNSETVTSTMIPPPGSSFHQHHHHHQHHPHQHRVGLAPPQSLQSGHVTTSPYQICNQHYTTSSVYDPVPTVAAAAAVVGNSGGDYCVNDGNYYLDDKSSIPCTSSRLMVGDGRAMRNSSGRKASFESSHLDSPSDYSENHHHHPSVPLSMRKCETVLALSNINGTSVSTTTTPTPLTANSNYAASGAAVAHYGNSSNGNVGGKVRGMKEKIFSTSSSALNCLLHSSSRTGKLWKLSSASSSSNSGSNTNVGHINMYGGSNEGSNCLGVNCQQNKHFLESSSTSHDNKLGSSVNNFSPARITNHHHHKSRSQLSISEHSYSSSPTPMTPINRLRKNISVHNTSFCPTGGSLSAHSRSSSVGSFGWKEKESPFDATLLCRLCLSNVHIDETMEIACCCCRYCKDCLISYVSFEIQQGADEIACPDASCEKQGVLDLMEVEHLVSPMLLEKHKKFRRFREVEKDSKLMWCPSPGCETVCQIQDSGNVLTGGFVTEGDRTHGSGGGGIIVASGGSRSLPFINCPTCRKAHCAECKLSWHPDSSCESFRRKLIKQGKLSSEDDELFSLDSIKKCPFCHVPIEKDSGCAQMMCKRCKHVFCWYCLASLDDDFLLRHYDKGPCKNKLGHSRASVIWHRAQVIGIFAGFGVLVLLASPLLILAAPCLLCCRCRYCANKLDPEESDLV